MKSVSPVIPNTKLPESIYTRNTTNDKLYLLEYISPNEETIFRLSRWKLNWLERIKVLFYGNIFIMLEDWNKVPRPITVQVYAPKVLK